MATGSHHMRFISHLSQETIICPVHNSFRSDVIANKHRSPNASLHFSPFICNALSEQGSLASLKGPQFKVVQSLLDELQDNQSLGTPPPPICRPRAFSLATTHDHFPAALRFPQDPGVHPGVQILVCIQDHVRISLSVKHSLHSRCKEHIPLILLPVRFYLPFSLLFLVLSA